MYDLYVIFGWVYWNSRWNQVPTRALYAASAGNALCVTVINDGFARYYTAWRLRNGKFEYYAECSTYPFPGIHDCCHVPY